ncbi:hypothetical protein SLS60_009126 [Paraconiothyrium brasiliense]|uniref:Uncharacterized protein n=1 Tax=Paraconiothyrium brasiliense TaxID=300254 RepID=A0ABR3QWI0_9PLEO
MIPNRLEKSKNYDERLTLLNKRLEHRANQTAGLEIPDTLFCATTNDAQKKTRWYMTPIDCVVDQGSAIHLIEDLFNRDGYPGDGRVCLPDKDRPTMSDFNRRLTIQDERLTETDKRLNGYDRRISELETRSRINETYTREQDERLAELDKRILENLSHTKDTIRQREKESVCWFWRGIALGMTAAGICAVGGAGVLW